MTRTKNCTTAYDNSENVDINRHYLSYSFCLFSSSISISYKGRWSRLVFRNSIESDFINVFVFLTPMQCILPTHFLMKETTWAFLSNGSLNTKRKDRHRNEEQIVVWLIFGKRQYFSELCLISFRQLRACLQWCIHYTKEHHLHLSW